MKKHALQVRLDVREPSVIELTVGDKVQLDRLTRSNHGHVAERHGELLDPGATTLALAPGFYCFRTLSDASLKVIRGGVTSSVGKNSKDGGGSPDLPKADDPQPSAMGDDAPGEAPSLTIDTAINTGSEK
jgi:hypothetical protein